MYAFLAESIETSIRTSIEICFSRSIYPTLTKHKFKNSVISTYFKIGLDYEWTARTQPIHSNIMHPSFHLGKSQELTPRSAMRGLVPEN